MAEDENDKDGENDQDQDDMDDGWGDLMGESQPSAKMSAIELDMIKKSHTLVRLISLLHQRVGSHHLPSPTLTDALLDRLLAKSNSISSSVDEYVSSLYIPQDPPNVQEKLHGLGDAIFSLRTILLPEKDTTATVVDALGTLNLTSDPPPQTKASKNMDWLAMCFTQIDKSINVMK